MESVFNGYRVTAQCRGGDGYVHMMHNARCPAVVSVEDHIDQNLPHEVLVDYGSVQKAFDIIFSEAVAEYNLGKKPSRQIKDYYEQIRNDSRKGIHKNKSADGSRKPAYEFIFQIGRRGEHPDNALAARILKDFTTKWFPAHYPNARIIQNTIHADEFSIDSETGERIPSPCHCHLDIVYVAHALTGDELARENERRTEVKRRMMKDVETRGEEWDEKKWRRMNWQKELVSLYGKSLTTGMGIQCSMTAALAEMGFYTEKGKGTAQQQFEEQVRHDLQDFAEKYGVKIDRSKGVKHRHIEKELYQRQRDNERKSVEILAIRSQLDRKEKTLTHWENEVTDKAKELIKKEMRLADCEKDIKVKQDFFERKQEAVRTFDRIGRKVRQQFLDLDSAERAFYDDSENHPIGIRIRTFIDSCKHIVVAAVSELAGYKKAFMRFWKATPDFFRNLASEMERNQCSDYESYLQKIDAAKLIGQKSAEKPNMRDCGGIGY
ncbi:MAG: hypothetical protein IJ530_12680 [Treponema sp.]|uniref:hypothetical protein n=1 Tax=Treponema sp. TaxID=166 RepID=UPI0025FBABDE|nr:hypothetical protein [Treponema sp.]MBQ8680596.1 hypothetical protein [Treponema sp.]